MDESSVVDANVALAAEILGAIASLPLESHERRGAPETPKGE
jgi:hypothetical protein